MVVHIDEVIYNKRVLRDQYIELGEITLIRGDSGSGKTTLLKQLLTKIDCGFITQDPDSMIVCDKVWHELAFGLENLGVDTGTIRSRVAEVATYLGLSDIINKDIMEISGGQKQKVCIASILCMAPKIILMDEPTAMLDPIVKLEFWSMVQRLNKDRGIKYVIVEHDSYVSRICDKRYVLRDSLLFEEDSREVIECERGKDLPESISLTNIRKVFGSTMVLNIDKLTLTSGVNAIIGPNAVGKTTLLRMLTGGFGEKRLLKGSVMMPQDVKIMFSKDTVKEELVEVPDILKDLTDRHPYDLSGGEQHILGVYMTLQRNADVYCFDEPTKGMDARTKRTIMNILKRAEKPVVLTSHDLDLVAEFADNVIFLFNREIASNGTPYQVFSSNLFYKPENVVWK